ncbi:C2 domain protein, partial [Teladorsagia circumcincta]
MWQPCNGSKPAPNAARATPVKAVVASDYEAPPQPPSGGPRPTIDDYALRRARFRSQGTTTSVSSSRSQATCGAVTTFLGEVQLVLGYDIMSACIKVHVIQCRSLPHFGSHKPNPYVKVILVSQDSKPGPVLKHKTTPRKSEINPLFDEILQVRTVAYLTTSKS